MNKIINTKLFSLLSETSSVTNQEIKSAYESFIEHITAANQSENDYSELFRVLNIARIELSTESFYQYEQGKKCPKINLSTKDVGTYQY
jgi:hypothetical protein